MTRAPRIDTLRNRLAATRQLLATVETEVDDLHLLAYNRFAASERAKVRGGDRDYALDTHGDPRARDAYKALGAAVETACDALAEAAHNAVALLRAGEPIDPSRGRKHTLDTEELAQQLEHQAARIARGEYTPTPTVPQPDAEVAAKVLDRVRRERDEARRLAERYLAQLNDLGHDPERRSRRGWRSRPVAP